MERLGWQCLMLGLSYFQSCKVHTDTTITCPSPAASNVTAGGKPAPVDFFLNGRLYADDHPALDEEMYPEEALHVSKFSLEYYADPQFFTAKKEKWIKHHPGEPLTLVIHVRKPRVWPCCCQGCLLPAGGSQAPLPPQRLSANAGERGGWERQAQAVLAQPSAPAPPRQDTACPRDALRGLMAELFVEDVMARSSVESWPEVRQVLWRLLTMGSLPAGASPACCSSGC